MITIPTIARRHRLPGIMSTIITNRRPRGTIPRSITGNSSTIRQIGTRTSTMGEEGSVPAINVKKPKI